MKFLGDGEGTGRLVLNNGVIFPAEIELPMLEYPSNVQ